MKKVNTLWWKISGLYYRIFKKKEIENCMSDEEMKEIEKFVLDNAYWLEKLPTKKRI